MTEISHNFLGKNKNIKEKAIEKTDYRFKIIYAINMMCVLASHLQGKASIELNMKKSIIKYIISFGSTLNKDITFLLIILYISTKNKEELNQDALIGENSLPPKGSIKIVNKLNDFVIFLNPIFFNN